MIIIEDRNLIIPPEEILIGCQEDNEEETRVFEVPHMHLADREFKLRLEGNPKEGTYIDSVLLDKEIQQNRILLTWLIKDKHLQLPGALNIQLYAFSTAGKKWHSYTKSLVVHRSISMNTVYPVLPSDFEELEIRLAIIKNDTVAAKDITVTLAGQVSSNAQTVQTNTTNVVKLAGEVAEDAEQVGTDRSTIESWKTEVATNTTTVNGKTDIVVTKEGIVSTKHAEVVTLAGQVDEDARQVADDKDTVVSKEAEARGSASAAAISEGKAKTSEDNAKDYADEAERQADIARNNILNGVAAHNESEESHPYVLSEMVRIESIARGKASAKVFDTTEEMNDWLSDPDNVETLKIGDNLYIRDINVPDYWWDGEQPQILEAQAINLSDYYTKQEVDAQLPIVIEQSDYDALVAAGTVIAGRIYYVVPDGTLEV